eukprot:5397435-Pleurochrysis_carterae.AAC.1
MLLAMPRFKAQAAGEEEGNQEGDRKHDSPQTRHRGRVKSKAPSALPQVEHDFNGTVARKPRARSVFQSNIRLGTLGARLSICCLMSLLKRERTLLNAAACALPKRQGAAFRELILEDDASARQQALSQTHMPKRELVLDRELGRRGGNRQRDRKASSQLGPGTEDDSSLSWGLRFDHAPEMAPLCSAGVHRPRLQGLRVAKFGHCLPRRTVARLKSAACTATGRGMLLDRSPAPLASSVP